MPSSPPNARCRSRWSSKTATWCGSSRAGPRSSTRCRSAGSPSDGKTLLPVDGAALKDRRRAGFNGTVVATLVLDRLGRLAAPPATAVIGLVESEAAQAIAPALRTAIERALDELPDRARADDAVVTEAARRALRRILNERFGKRPLVEIQVVRI